MCKCGWLFRAAGFLAAAWLSGAAWAQSPVQEGAGPAAIPGATRQLIVKFRNDAGSVRATMRMSDRVSLLAADTGLPLSLVRPMALGAHVLSLGSMHSLADASAIAARLAADPDVEFAEVDRHMHRAMVPNDPLISRQTPYLGPTPPAINAYGAWDTTVGSANVVVAVIDTGYRPHADLAGRILPGYDFITDPVTANDGDGRDADATDPGDWVSQADLNGAFRGSGCVVENSSWHGTGTASIIAANSNNGTSMAGLNWSAKILPVRVLGKCGGMSSDIADAIAWAGGLPVPGVPVNPTPAQVINLSLGGDGGCSAAEQTAINNVLAHGVTRAIVVAAGNENANVAASDPANCVGVIAVAAANNAGGKASYSNFGGGVTLSAPGGDSPLQSAGVVALGNTGITLPVSDATFVIAGTSAAAPIVAGVVSLMLAVAPNLTAAQVRSILTSSVQAFPAGSTCNASICGPGIVNAQGAVQMAVATSGGLNYQGLWWVSGGGESGWGIHLAHQGDAIFATWLTYDLSGNAWWLSMTADKVSNGVYTGTLNQSRGPAFNEVPFDPNAVMRTPVGTGTLTFTAANAARFDYMVNTASGTVTQSKSLVPQLFGTRPTCVWGQQANLAAATNEQDLWWAAPAGSESGWGINFSEQGGVIFATWFTYDAAGNPLWYSATLNRTGPGAFAGALVRTKGPAFNAAPFNPGQVTRTTVGSAGVVFSDGNNATFSYQVNDGANVANQAKAITRQVFNAPGTACN